MKYIFLLVLFTLQSYAQEAILDIAPSSDMSSAHGEVDEKECEIPLNTLPSGFISYVNDFGAVNKVIIPSNSPFYAVKLSEVPGSGDILVKSGLFMYELREDGLYIVPAPLKLDTDKEDETASSTIMRPEEPVKVDFASSQILGDHQYIMRQMVIEQSLQRDLTVPMTEVLPPKPESQLNLPSTDIGIPIGEKSRMSFTGGLIDLSETDFVMKQIDEEINDLSMRPGGGDPTRLQTLIDARNRMQSTNHVLQTLNGGQPIGGRTPYVSITLTFP